MSGETECIIVYLLLPGYCSVKYQTVYLET